MPKRAYIFAHEVQNELCQQQDMSYQNVKALVMTLERRALTIVSNQQKYSAQ